MMNVTYKIWIYKVPLDLSDFQARQWHHDKHYHVDIDNLPLARKMLHLVLHLNKYNGRLADGALLPPTLVDTVLILMSMGNALNLPLDNRQMTRRERGASYLIRAVGLAGRMSAAMEKWDHLENFPFRQKLEAAVRDHMALTLGECHQHRILVPVEIERRWHGMEEKDFQGRPRTPLKHLKLVT